MRLIQNQSWIDAAFILVVCLLVFVPLWTPIDGAITALVGAGADNTIILMCKLIPLTLIYALIRNFLVTSSPQISRG